MISRRQMLQTTAAGAAGLALNHGRLQAAIPTSRRYIDPLPKPGVYTGTMGADGVKRYVVPLYARTQRLHTDLNPTVVWTYDGTYPGKTFEARRGDRIEVRFVNNLPATHLFAIDRTLPDLEAHPEWADVRVSVHRHGGHQNGVDDGHPDAFVNVGGTQTLFWPNTQDPATLWYHDHAAGITRINVYAGLAGFFLVRDDAEDALGLPSGAYEIPLAIQDRTFNTDGSLFYPSVGRWPQNHPVWVKHFFGDTPVVNGVAYPYLEVEPRKYRFRLLNGSNARLYNLALWNRTTGAGHSFYQIGTDVGLMLNPVQSGGITMTPGERADVVIDFRGKNGQEILLVNNERLDGPDLPEIMLFRVRSNSVSDTSRLPSQLRSSLARYSPAAAVRTRDVTIEHLDDAHGDPIAFLLDGMFRHHHATELVGRNSIEVWNLINVTSETHPIHLHLADVQVLDRQPFDKEKYHNDLMTVRHADHSAKPNLANYLKGTRVGPRKFELGNKDTVQAPAGIVTRIVVKFAEYTGDTVWNCHILEHEDNDMMRPLIVS